MFNIIMSLLAGGIFLGVTGFVLYDTWTMMMDGLTECKDEE